MSPTGSLGAGPALVGLGLVLVATFGRFAGADGRLGGPGARLHRRPTRLIAILVFAIADDLVGDRVAGAPTGGG